MRKQHELVAEIKEKSDYNDIISKDLNFTFNHTLEIDSIINGYSGVSCPL
ncbi:MAG: hypothetical protein JKY08_02085 [Flavobacteriaceae bacterium]|nr:hypothetical protein [Flavobacteriaceae bacterium]